VTKQQWRFAGRKWIPLMGEVLTWQMTMPQQKIPLTYAMTPEDFWAVPQPAA
jgi:hypothetical protein